MKEHRCKTLSTIELLRNNLSPGQIYQFGEEKIIFLQMGNELSQKELRKNKYGRPRLIMPFSGHNAESEYQMIYIFCSTTRRSDKDSSFLGYELFRLVDGDKIDLCPDGTTVDITQEEIEGLINEASELYPMYKTFYY